MSRKSLSLLGMAALLVLAKTSAAQSAPENVWMVPGLSGFSISADYSPNGKFILFQSAFGNLQLWNSAGKMLWSRNVVSKQSMGAAFSTDSLLVLVPSSAGVVRLDSNTGDVVDTLPAVGLSGVPTGVAQYGSTLALATSTTAYVYRYPSMSPLAAFDHGANAGNPLALVGRSYDPMLVVGMTTRSGPVGTRIFDADTGTFLRYGSGYPISIVSAGKNSQVFGVDTMANGPKHLYVDRLIPFGSAELDAFYGGPTGGNTYSMLQMPSSLDRSARYLGIATRDATLTSQRLQFVDIGTGTVRRDVSLGLTHSSISGQAGVRFSPATDAFVLFGTNAGGTHAYLYTYNPTTLDVSAPKSLLGGIAVDGTTSSSALVHGVVAGKPVTISTTKAFSPAVGTFRVASKDGTGYAGYSFRVSDATEFAGLATSPDGSRLAYVAANSVRMIDLATGALLATSATMSPAGIAFLDNNTIYTGSQKLTYSGSGFSAEPTSTSVASPMASPNGALVIGRSTVTTNGLVITDLAGTALSRFFPARPTAYGFVGNDKVWVSYSTTNTDSWTVRTEFYTTDWSSTSDQTNRSVTYVRPGGRPESAGSRVSPDGKWVATWYTAYAQNAFYGGSGDGLPSTGTLTFQSAQVGASVQTTLPLRVVDTGISSAAFDPSGPRFEYGTGGGTVMSVYVPPYVQSATASPSVLRGGNRTIVTVNLSHAAGPAGVTVPFALSSNLSAATSSVTVAPGKTSGTVTIESKGVAADSAESINFGAVTVPITLQPAVLAKASLTPATLTGGSQTILTVTLDGQAPPDSYILVELASNVPAAKVPQYFPIFGGTSSNTLYFNPDAVATSQTGAISVSYQGVVKNTYIKVLPPKATAFTLTPDAATGGETVTGTITLDGPAPAGGLTISMNSSNRSAVPVVYANFPGGATQATFSIPTRAVTTETSVLLTAKVAGSYITATLVVRP